MSEEFKVEKFTPPPPPSPPEIASKVGEVVATVLQAPADALGVVKGFLDRGATEVRKGPIPR